jgi:hypothetical protein
MTLLSPGLASYLENEMEKGSQSQHSRYYPLNLLFERTQAELSLAASDLDITITETPKHNWGFRGQPGDEISLNYKVNI